MTALLELQSVTKSYRAPAVTALREVDLAIELGQTVAITGPSGSGKSTLLTVLGTLERPTSGTVRFSGVDLAVMGDAELSGLRGARIGFVFQQFHLLGHLSVLDNVASGLLYRGQRAARRRVAAADALERVGLGHRLDHRPDQLSGGERQRAAIARAVVGGPTIVLADEPTGNLDSASGAQIIALLVGLADERTSVVVITHDLAVAAAMDRQVRLLDGRIQRESGAP